MQLNAFHLLKCSAFVALLSCVGIQTAMAVPPGMPGFTVNSDQDQADSNAGDGNCNTAANTCTLRAAIQESNANNNLNFIDFNIVPVNPNQTVITIAPNSQLPVITSPVFLAEEQPNRQIVLDGSNLNLIAPIGLKIDAGNSVVTGLEFSNFSGNSGGCGLFLATGDQNLVQANKFISNKSGLCVMSNSDSNEIKNNLFQDSEFSGAVFMGSKNNQILSNVMVGNLRGLTFSSLGTKNNVVRGNTIGPVGMFSAANKNSVGVFIQNSPENVIGGTGPGEGNIISNNSAEGIFITMNGSTENQIIGNWIGTNAQGNPLGNGSYGIKIDGAINTKIGLFEVQNAGNTIAFNTGLGIFIGLGAGNEIASNSIYKNQAAQGPQAPQVETSLGILPVINLVEKGYCQAKIAGVLESITPNFPNEDFRLEFFANKTTGGQRILGSTIVTTDAQSHASFSFSIPTTDLDTLETVTVIATRLSTHDSSSSASPVGLMIVNPALGTFSLSQNSYTASENAGTLKIKVIRSNHLDCEALVTLETVDQSAVAGGDYTTLNVPITFLAGETSKEIDLSILEDTIFEGDETLKVKLINSANNFNFNLADPSEAIVTIIENDTPSGPAILCGNGLIETGESCDDQNPKSGDGCSASCAIEEGYSCVGTPSQCKPLDGSNPDPNHPDNQNPSNQGASGCELSNASSSASTKALALVALPLMFVSMRRHRCDLRAC